MSRPTPVLYLDIDGTVREGRDDPLGRFVNGPDDVRVFPEAAEQIARWRRDGWKTVGISNQGGVALGYISREDVAEAMAETQRQLYAAVPEAHLDIIRVCPHHPDATDDAWAHCWCRKPSVGALAAAFATLETQFSDSIFAPAYGVMVGDRALDDGELADRAGLPFLFAHQWRAGADHLDATPS